MSTKGDDRNKLLSEIEKMVANKRNGDLFASVRQRVSAYRMYRAYHKLGQYKKVPECDYLDGAYSFLNSPVEPKFLIFCAKRKSMDPKTYVYLLLGQVGDGL